MTHCVYIHQNKSNLKVYVGYSTNIYHRWATTKSNAFRKNGREYKEPLYQAIRRDGWDGFDHLIIEEFDNKKEALEAEIFWIQFFRSNRKVYGQDYGYNLHEGGNVPPKSVPGRGKGRQGSDDFRKKCSIRMMGNQYPLGHKDSDATRKLKSLAAKVRPKSTEFIEWMHKDKSGDKHPHFEKT